MTECRLAWSFALQTDYKQLLGFLI